MARIVVCKVCNEEKKLHAKGMCKKCYMRQWREDNPDYHRQWLADNPGYNRQDYHRQWRAEHPEYHAEYNRQYYKENAEAIAAYSRQYVQENPAKVRAKSLRRRARKRNAAVNDFTAADWQAVLAHYDNKCAYCGETEMVLVQEHIIPLSRGGNNTISNVAPACKSCNSRKRTKTPAEAGMYLWKLPLTHKELTDE